MKVPALVALAAATRCSPSASANPAHRSALWLTVDRRGDSLTSARTKLDAAYVIADLFQVQTLTMMM